MFFIFAPSLVSALVLTLAGGLPSSRAYDILAIFPQVYRSHSLIYNPILLELAKRGHNVTSYSWYQVECLNIATLEIFLHDKWEFVGIYLEFIQE